MSDLIDRQATIDALGKGLWGVEWDKALAEKMLRDLPSVQPEHATCYLDSPCEYQNINIALPSAQPEGCPFYIENIHDRGDDSLCRLFHREVKCLAVETRQVGRWIYDNCSVCGQYVYHGDARNYCPNCGAKMEADNET